MNRVVQQLELRLDGGLRRWGRGGASGRGNERAGEREKVQEGQYSEQARRGERGAYTWRAWWRLRRRRRRAALTCSFSSEATPRSETRARPVRCSASLLAALKSLMLAPAAGGAAPQPSAAPGPVSVRVAQRREGSRSAPEAGGMGRGAGAAAAAPVRPCCCWDARAGGGDEGESTRFAPLLPPSPASSFSSSSYAAAAAAATAAACAAPAV